MEESDFQFQGSAFDLKAYNQMFLRFIDIHSFGDFRISTENGRRTPL